MTEHDVWHRYKKFFAQEGAKFTLQGHAISARSSGFWIPEYQIMFDAGICSPFHPLHIFITHSHSDHTFMLPAILTGINTKPHVYVPRGTAQLFRNLLIAKHRLSRCDVNAPYDVDQACTLVEVQDGDLIPITVKGGLPMVVKVFATEHKVLSVGFALFHVRSRLNPEFTALKGPELAQKRKEGVELNMAIQVPCVAYVGDSTPKWVSHRLFTENVFPIVICECTFVGELEQEPQRAIDSAAEHGHTCWSELGPLLAKKEDESAKTMFVLVHWSDRYDLKEIHAFFAKRTNLFAWTN